MSEPWLRVGQECRHCHGGRRQISTVNGRMDCWYCSAGIVYRSPTDDEIVAAAEKIQAKRLTSVNEVVA